MISINSTRAAKTEETSALPLIVYFTGILFRPQIFCQKRFHSWGFGVISSPKRNILPTSVGSLLPKRKKKKGSYWNGHPCKAILGTAAQRTIRRPARLQFPLKSASPCSQSAPHHFEESVRTREDSCRSPTTSRETAAVEGA